jgi:hypothetical protein
MSEQEMKGTAVLDDRATAELIAICRQLIKLHGESIGRIAQLTIALGGKVESILKGDEEAG